MRFLLDTHTFLWYYSGSSYLTEKARLIISNPENESFISIASLWEIAIKHRLGKLELDTDFDSFCKNVVEKGFLFLPIDAVHIIKSSKLEFHHRDPFDRIIIAQAIVENLDLITKDSIVDLYLKNERIQKIW